MESVIYFGKGVHTIMIRRTSYELVTTKQTSLSGILRFEFPSSGTYNLICIDNPTLSKVDYRVDGSPSSGHIKHFDTKLAGSTSGTVDTAIYAAHYSVVDNTGTELNDAIDNGDFKVGDIFIETANMDWAPIIEIDPDNDRIIVSGIVGTMRAATGLTWKVSRA